MQKKNKKDDDKKIHDDLIERLKAKGLVLIKGIWQKPIKNEKNKS